MLKLEIHYSRGFVRFWWGFFSFPKLLGYLLSLGGIDDLCLGSLNHEFMSFFSIHGSSPYWCGLFLSLVSGSQLRLPPEFKAALVILPVSLLSNMVGFLNFLVPDVEAAISLMNPGYLYLETVFSKHNLGPWVLFASYWISALVKVLSCRLNIPSAVSVWQF